MTTYNEVLDSHMALMVGKTTGAGEGLNDWLNGYLASAANELIPSDLMLGWDIKPPTYNTTRPGQFTTSRMSHRYSTNRGAGIWKSKHAFQTCQFIWFLMQTAAPTTENTPTSYNTHALTIPATNVPLWKGIHFEREGITSNELRYDLYGMLPSDLVINCGASKDNYKATQEITIPFAYLKRDAVDLAAQTPRDTGATGSIWKDWDHIITGNGGGDVPSGLTYNSAQLEVDIINISLKFHRDYYFGPASASATAAIRGTPLSGLMLGWDYSIVLQVIPNGDLLYILNNTKAEDYAGHLDYDFYFNADNINDKIRFNYDELYMVPFDEVNDYNKYIEGYTITLEPFDKDSSVVITGIDNLDKTAYENP